MGRYVADYVTTNLDGKAKIALLTIPKYEVGQQRREGFVAEISKVPGIEIVAEQEGELPEPSANTLETILQANPDVSIVWAANEGGTVGAITAVRASGAAVKVFGTDMSLQTAAALLDANSGLVAVSTQDPFTIGYRSAQLALAKIAGEAVPAEEIVPLQMFTTDKPEDVTAYLDKYKALAAN